MQTAPCSNLIGLKLTASSPLDSALFKKKKWRWHSHNTKLTIVNCTVWWHLVYSRFCNHYLHLVSKPFPCSQRKCYIYQAAIPYSLAPRNHHSFGLYGFPILDISYKFNHTIGDLLYLACFTEHDICNFHPSTLLHVPVLHDLVAE